MKLDDYIADRWKHDPDFKYWYHRGRAKFMQRQTRMITREDKRAGKLHKF